MKLANSSYAYVAIINRKVFHFPVFISMKEVICCLNDSTRLHWSNKPRAIVVQHNMPADIHESRRKLYLSMHELMPVACIYIYRIICFIAFYFLFRNLIESNWRSITILPFDPCSWNTALFSSDRFSNEMSTPWKVDGLRFLINDAACAPWNTNFKDFPFFEDDTVHL